MKNTIIYHKWLRYYLDFSHKYQYQASDCNSLPHYIKKAKNLKDKRQSSFQTEQSEHAINLYYTLVLKPDQEYKLVKSSLTPINFFTLPPHFTQFFTRFYPIPPFHIFLANLVLDLSHQIR